MQKRTEIVIVGNGFGGTYTLKSLQRLLKGRKDTRLTLIGEKNYFLFTPLLHEVATGSINPENIVEPIRKVFKRCLDEFYLGKATHINLEQQTVEVVMPKDKATLKYDYLVLSGGAETNFYNTKGAQEHSMSLKSLEDAIKIKNHIIGQLERASHLLTEEEQTKALHFVIVGGGPTGVELAAELTEFIKDTFSKYYHPTIMEKVEITLIQKGLELLPQFNQKVRKKSLEVLTKKGVRVLLNHSVEEVTKEKVVLHNQEELATESVFWVAGIKPTAINFEQSIEMLPDKRIITDEYLNIPLYKNVFVLGDMSAVKSGDSYLPALAQVAEKEAKNVAKNIKGLLDGKSIKSFRYRHLGTMVSLGQWMAIGEISSVIFSGKFTWWLWRTVYLSKMISSKKKFKIAVDWTIGIFSPRDISEL